MQKWVKNELVDTSAPTMRASVQTIRGGGQLTYTVIASSIWVKMKNGQWLRRAIVEQIGAAFKGATVVFLSDAILLTGERFAYRFKTYPKGRLARGKKNEP
jgi:hypothetical protein